MVFEARQAAEGLPRWYHGDSHGRHMADASLLPGIILYGRLPRMSLAPAPCRESGGFTGLSRLQVIRLHGSDSMLV